MALSKSTMVGQPEFLVQERLQDPGRQRSLTADRASLRLAAMLLLVGELLFVVIGLFHPAYASRRSGDRITDREARWYLPCRYRQ